DPMIAKLVAWGKDREEAIHRMIRAIDEYEITGIQSTLAFGKFVMNHTVFQDGRYNTGFVEAYFNSEAILSGNEDEAKIAALLMNYIFSEKQFNRKDTNSRALN